ncbi:MAG TPA: hypothetical protein VFY18_12020 [Candidatus Limnocylindrales bacterium]|nr:hypothetical protein [Candidatus Limnocylindrales bacterium]
MTTPRTVAGQAWLSGTRPFVRRALSEVILSIETEAVAPYLEALREADGVLESLAGGGEADSTPSDLLARAQAAHRRVTELMEQAR